MSKCKGPNLPIRFSLVIDGFCSQPCLSQRRPKRSVQAPHSVFSSFFRVFSFLSSCRALPDFDSTLAATRDALKANGFGVITEVDFCAVFKAKLDRDVPRAVQLGACSPKIAIKIYEKDPSAATLLPCMVMVQEVEGCTRVTFTDPMKTFPVMRDDVHPDVLAAAQEAAAGMRAAADAL